MSVIASFKLGGKKIALEGYSQNDWIYKSIIKKKTFYEIELLKYMKFALRKRSGFILDVGANIGNHSVFFGLIMNRKVVCFEANPSVFGILERNLNKNHVIYEAFNFGLGAEDASFEINETHEGAKDNIGAVKLSKALGGEIRVKPLDKVFNEIKFQRDGLVAIKVDIEGMEPAMLKGATGVLKNYRPDLFVEINDDAAMKKIERILFQLDYKKLYSYADSPVWHFSHATSLSNLRWLELTLYTLVMKSIRAFNRITLSVFKKIFCKQK
ncbi:MULTISPECIES: FkbM family methyltransferase [Cycloclasticus]|uniref:FkbM family methyltransferase n=1 Tax=Cycloclasticus pugetii TaxID=34068 RepID=A0AB33YYC5_9GAMM|nr:MULTISPECIES: FkbM family methyltransferase [Cycloclasticus]ATI03997.1 FkbM family methyltransferase [Cycloclasticus sp. PY97N]EPD12215.1 FkbM family methyltransferase [Cycloclasticus pugetii]